MEEEKHLHAVSIRPPGRRRSRARRKLVDGMFAWHCKPVAVAAPSAHLARREREALGVVAARVAHSNVHATPIRSGLVNSDCE